MTHTPGPWKITDNGLSDDDKRIWIVSEPQGVYDTVTLICEMPADNTAEIQATTKLIAAAPELLENLKQCVSALEYWFPRWGDPEGASSQMMKNSRTAIAKAEGRE